MKYATLANRLKIIAGKLFGSTVEIRLGISCDEGNADWFFVEWSDGFEYRTGYFETPLAAINEALRIVSTMPKKEWPRKED